MDENTTVQFSETIPMGGGGGGGGGVTPQNKSQGRGPNFPSGGLRNAGIAERVKY